MPKDRFFRIKEQKREEILRAALEEIGAHGFTGANVTRVVQAAGIATGSFYQYFEDIDDLLSFVLMEAAHIKAQYLQAEFEALEDRDIESTIRALYRGGLRFASERADFARLSTHIYEIIDSPLMKKSYADATGGEIYEWLTTVITQAIENGELREGITMPLFYSLLLSINRSIGEYLLATGSYEDQRADTRMIEETCDLAVQVLLHGITK